MVEGSASFGTAKLCALIELQQKFISPTAVFSISLRGEYDNSAKIILLNWVKPVFNPFSRNALQSYSMTGHLPKNDSETNRFNHHISKLVLTRVLSSTNISF